MNINGQKSDPFTAHLGVNQRSLLFIVFGNDLVFIVKFAIEFIFADDFKLLKVLSSDRHQI